MCLRHVVHHSISTATVFKYTAHEFYGHFSLSLSPSLPLSPPLSLSPSLPPSPPLSLFSTYLKKDLSLPEKEVLEITKLVLKKVNCHMENLMRLVFFDTIVNSLKVSTTDEISSTTLDKFYFVATVLCLKAVILDRL